MTNDTLNEAESIAASLVQKELHEELGTSYLEYAMSTIVDRALPDIRDGLKPVQRRILWSMWRNGYTHDKEFRKCAKTVGAVIADYHPHGDSSVYGALVRLSQRFSMRYPLIDFHGNNGSANGELPAAHRYTESRLDELAEDMLTEIEQETVIMKPNFDGEFQEPTVLPSLIPNLLINGSQGIAVAISTSIPSHNLTEVLNATRYILKHNDSSLDDILKFIKAPDFPSGAIITNTPQELYEIYRTGHGSIIQRAQIEIEERSNNAFNLIVTELPWQVHRKDDDKQGVVADIERIIADKKIPQIVDVIDGSEGESVHITIRLKPGSRPKEILNLLYNTTQLEARFPVYMMALNVDHTGKLVPRNYNLFSILADWIFFRLTVIRKKYEYLNKKAEEKLHLRQGRLLIVDKLDQVIDLIKSSENPKEAQQKLETAFSIDSIQSEDIINRPLRSLTTMDRDSLYKEIEDLSAEITEHTSILQDENRLKDIFDKQLEEIIAKYGDKRRSRLEPREIPLQQSSQIFWERDVPAEVEEKTIAVTLSSANYLKCTDVDTYRVQHRGGKGVSAMTLKDEEYIKLFLTVSTHDFLLFFTNMGKMFVIPAYSLPIVQRTARGTPITAYLNLYLEGMEEVEHILAIPSLDQGSLLFVTKKGIVKSTSLDKFVNVRSKGIKAITLDEDDKLVAIDTVKPRDLVVISTKLGKANLFDEADIRSVGRVARGVIGIRLKETDEVVSAAVIHVNVPAKHDLSEEEIKKLQIYHCNEVELLTISEKGLAKRTLLSKYRKTKRGSQGVKNMSITEKTGNVVSVHVVPLIEQMDEDEEGELTMESESPLEELSEGSTETIEQNSPEDLEDEPMDDELESQMSLDENNKKLNCDPNLQLITVSSQAMLTRMPVRQIRRTSRVTQGVRVMNLHEGEILVSSHITLAPEDVEDE